MPEDPLLEGLGVGPMEEPASGETDTDDMAAEMVADDLEKGLAGDRPALLRAIRVLMRK